MFTCGGHGDHERISSKKFSKNSSLNRDVTRAAFVHAKDEWCIEVRRFSFSRKQCIRFVSRLNFEIKNSPNFAVKLQQTFRIEMSAVIVIRPNPNSVLRSHSV